MPADAYHPNDKVLATVLAKSDGPPSNARSSPLQTVLSQTGFLGHINIRVYRDYNGR